MGNNNRWGFEMDNKQLLAIILAIIIAGLIISIGCFYGLSEKNTANTSVNLTNNTTSNITNTTTNDDTTAQEKTTDTDYEQTNQEKIEFNGKTHSQNVQEAKKSRDEGKQWAGATDEEIEEMISREERDGGRI